MLNSTHKSFCDMGFTISKRTLTLHVALSAGEAAGPAAGPQADGQAADHAMLCHAVLQVKHVSSFHRAACMHLPWLYCNMLRASTMVPLT